MNILSIDGKTGHALVAYKIVGPTIFMSDPNTPGDISRTTTLVGNKFSQYVSGEQADNMTEVYSRIFFIGVTSAIGWDKAGALWSKFDDGSVGRELFDPYALLIYGPSGPRILGDTAETSTASVKLGLIASGVNELRVTIYNLGSVVTPAADGSIPLTSPSTYLSFYVEKKVNGKWMWNDYRSVLVVRKFSPSIDTIIPPTAPAGALVEIHGFNFGVTASANKVTFNGKVAEIAGWSDTAIVAKVPPNCTSGPVIVTVGDSVSNPKHFSVIGGLLADMHKMTGLSVLFSADTKYSDGVSRSPYFRIPAGDPTARIVWTGDTTFILNGTYNGPFDYVTTSTITGSVTSDGLYLVKLDALVTLGPKAGQPGAKETLHLVLTGLHQAATTTDGQGTSDVSFQFYGPQAESHVPTVTDRIEKDDGTVVTYVSTNWASTDTPAQPYVTISR